MVVKRVTPAGVPPLGRLTIPSDVVPSKNSTEPTGLVAPAAAVIVAVKFTFDPYTDVAALEVTAVVVLRFASVNA